MVMIIHYALTLWYCLHLMFEIYLCRALFCSCVSCICAVCNWVTGDKLVGEVSRLVVAEACIQAIDIEFTEGDIYEINSVKVNFKRWFKYREHL